VTDDLTILDRRVFAGHALAVLFAWVRGEPLTGAERHELYQAGNRWRREEKRARSAR
jgi:cytosine/adenosine deaminase-related metal-dependent hydrolase